VVKGKTEPIVIYELMEDTKENRTLVKLFEVAYNIYLKGDFVAAKIKFSEIFSEYSDGLSEVYFKRCEELERSGTDLSSWNGVYIAKDK